MVRYIPTQVPAAMSRLITSTLVRKPPTWYAPVINNPPPAVPLRRAVRRNRPHEGRGYEDLPARAEFGARREGQGTRHAQKHLREPKPRTRDIVYLEDAVRRQFFADFPFEALRPVSLVEADGVKAEHAVRGDKWTSLAQRGAYPTVEDTVAFALTLHAQTVPGPDGKPQPRMSLSDAYAQATSEFIALRAAHEMATLAAQNEALYYGAEFKRSEFQRTFDKEEKYLDEAAASRSGVAAATGHKASIKHKEPRKWSAEVKAGTVPSGEFTGGTAYALRWRLPPAAQSDGPRAGDLVSAIGVTSTTTTAAPAKTASTPDAKNEDEMDDLELMAAILGNK